VAPQISLRLPDDLARRLDRLAAKRRTERSLVVREAIHAYVAAEAATRSGRPFDLVADLAGSVRGGPPDLGRRHREYLKERLGGG
jgi:Arc/MetJ-type ribon-helix-helix transcriptional regulator